MSGAESNEKDKELRCKDESNDLVDRMIFIMMMMTMDTKEVQTGGPRELHLVPLGVTKGEKEEKKKVDY